MSEENLSAVPLRAPKRGGRSITILVANDILGYMEDDLDLARVIVDDVVKRDEYGFKKYGQNLESNDGRPTIWDMYQELLDALQYNRKLIEEKKMPTEMASVYPTLLEVTRITRNSILNNKEREDALEWTGTGEEKNLDDIIKKWIALTKEHTGGDGGGIILPNSI